MAKILLTAPLAGIRGAFGGAIYSANLSGPYVKPYAIPVNPRTPKQTIQRAFRAQLNSEWRALSGAQQTAWDVFAALPAQDQTDSLGQTYSLSGFGWFVKTNTRLSRIPRAHIVTPPTQARPAAPTISTFVVAAALPDTNQAVGGVASASGSSPGLPPTLAFDANLATNWQAPLGLTTGWLRYNCPLSVELNSYRIYTRGAVRSNDPLDWTFEYWTGMAWVPLDTQVSFAFPNAAWTDFPIAAPVSFFPDYRIDVTANNGGGVLQITEMEYLGHIRDRSEITYPAGTFDAIPPPDYDLLLHVAMGATEGQRVHYPNFYEVLVSNNPNNTTEFTQTELQAVFGTLALGRSWFARLYRQTTEGLRSAPGTARTTTLP